MKSLYNITTEAIELASALEEGEFTPEMETALAINQNELQEKAIQEGTVSIEAVKKQYNISEQNQKLLTNANS
jgi:hypothetical protein